ncbi:MAG: hypothetical protein HRU26_08795 [Psychroserpens sp.]|nr:hypothetical protein [Psychroserpens sp.]
MAIALFFNTSYFDDFFPDSTTAARRFSEVVLGLKTAISYGAENYLVSAVGATTTLLAHDYTVRNWISDRRTIDNSPVVDKDLQRYFASKLSRAPFFEEKQYKNNDNFLESEVELCVGGETAINIDATHALVHSGILLSPGLSVFTVANVDCSVIHIEDESYQSKVRCIGNERMAVEHSSYIQQHAGLKISCSYDIWINRAQFFPNLELCSRVEQQLNALDKWNVILERLFELEAYSFKWKSGAFDPDLIPSKTTGEGQQVRNNTKAKEARTFSCPDNQDRLFLWHQRATPGAIRIYFYPVEDEQRIIVGHIGAKLYYPT